jgi:membrane protein DedA with SNARE-associated domain
VSTLVADIGLLASQNLFLAYFIIYIATIFLGNISAFASFWIVFQGYFGMWGVPFLILTIFLADVTGDLLWYALGRATRDTKFGRWIKHRLPSWHGRVERAFERNGKRWIILSKFFYASAFPVIFSAGWSRMEFKKFFHNSVLSVVIWLPILIGLSYGLISGLAPLRAVAIFRNFELAFFIGLVLFLLLDYFIAKFIEKAFRRED